MLCSKEALLAPAERPLGESKSCNIFQLFAAKRQSGCTSPIRVEEWFNSGVAWGLAGVIHRDVKDEVKE